MAMSKYLLTQLLALQAVGQQLLVRGEPQPLRLALREGHLDGARVPSIFQQNLLLVQLRDRLLRALHRPHAHERARQPVLVVQTCDSD